MTVAASTSKVQYNCNGSTVAFAFTFGVSATSEVKVIKTDAAGVETVLTETTHYSVSATNNDYSSGGTVTTVSTYATGNKITIERDVPITQESAYTEGMATLYGSFEEGLDKLTRIAQQQQEEITRIPKMKASTAYSNITFPDPSASKVIGWNSLGTDLENKTMTITTVGATNVVYLSNYASFAAALTSIGSTKTTLIIDTGAAVLVDTTTPATLEIVNTIMGGFTISSGKTLTINGHFNCGTYRAFSGGSVVFNKGAINNVFAEWFGADASDTSDDTAAIQAALDSIYAAGGTLELLAGNYYITAVSVVEFGGINIIAKGKSSTNILKYGTGTTAMLTIYHVGSSPLSSYSVLKGFKMTGNSKACDGIAGTLLARYTIDDVMITGCNNGLNMAGCLVMTIKDTVLQSNNAGATLQKSGSIYPNMIKFKDCIIGSNTTWGVYYNHGGSVFFDNCDYESNGTSGSTTYGSAINIAANTGDETGYALVSIRDCHFESNYGHTILTADLENIMIFNIESSGIYTPENDSVRIAGAHSVNIKGLICPAVADTVTISKAIGSHITSSRIGVLADSSTGRMYSDLSTSSVSYTGIWTNLAYLYGSLQIRETGASPTYATVIEAGNQSGAIGWVLPTAQGGAGTKLTNDGSGNLSWT